MYEFTDSELNAAFDNYFKNAVGSVTSEETVLSVDLPVDNPIERATADTYTGNGAMSDIDQVGELLRKLLNAAWGSDWGEITPEFSLGENPEEARLPIITYDVMSREVAQNIGKFKPMLTETYNEVEGGVATGDVIQVYSQWFDCVVEFNCWGRSSLETRKLLNRFEYVLSFYSGFIKQQGVQEIFFLKEIPAKQSVHYVDDYYMKAVLFFVRLERKSFVRQSTFKEIEVVVVGDETTGETAPDNIYSSSKINYAL